MEIHIHIYEEAPRVAREFAQWLHRWVQQTEPERPLHIALSGGSTPKLLFQVLAKDYRDRFPWERMHFWWGDERCVPPEDKQSNYHMTQQYLLSQVSVPEENVHRIRGEAANAAEEAQRYRKEIQEQVPHRGGLPSFDLIMLGMGDDGHTASIFPPEMHLLEDEDLVATATHPQSRQSRITFTGPLLNQAQTVAFLVTGERKAGRVAQVLGGRPWKKHLPAYHVQPAKGVLHWFLDQPAAGDLRG